MTRDKTDSLSSFLLGILSLCGLAMRPRICSVAPCPPVCLSVCLYFCLFCAYNKLESSQKAVETVVHIYGTRKACIMSSVTGSGTVTMLMTE